MPEGISVVFLPPYSPELQPAERLWPLVDEAVVNRHFATLDALDAAVAQQQREEAAEDEERGPDHRAGDALQVDASPVVRSTARAVPPGDDPPRSSRRRVVAGLGHFRGERSGARNQEEP